MTAMQQNKCTSSDFERSRSVSNILVVSLSLLRTQPWLFVTAACATVAYNTVVLVMTDHGPFGRPPEKFSLLSSSTSGTAVLMFVPVVAALYVRIDSILSEKPMLTRIHVGIDSLKVLPMVTISQIIAYLGVGLAGIFFILPGLVLWLRWFVVAPVVAVEQQGIIGALRRSAWLTAGHDWYILGLLLVQWALVLATMLCAHAIEAGSTVSVGVVASEVVVQTVITSYMALTITMLYFELSARSQRSNKDGE
jgi:hypothetical protein